MIHLNFQQKLSELSKSVLDIARETDINRNTITALMKNDVTGIKFHTLEKLCSKYGWNVSDLISYQAKNEWRFEDVYRQEGEGVPLTMDSPAVACGVYDFTIGKNKRMGYHSVYVHIEDGQGYWYFDRPKMNQLARGLYEYNKTEPVLNSLLLNFDSAAVKLEQLYLNTNQDHEQLIESSQQILHFYKNVWRDVQECWRYSIFVDSFDAGIDREIIESEQEKHNLSLEEVSILTTPLELPYSYEMEFEALRLLRNTFQDNEALATARIEKMLKDSALLLELLHKYAYVHSNYAVVKFLSLQDVLEIAKKYQNKKSKIEEKIKEYEQYADKKRIAIRRVLQDHGLKTNPLEFFARLTYLREYRKQINLMSIHLTDFA